eukprot:16437255-Heterocapsa_arctica.AAC.1
MMRFLSFRFSIISGCGGSASPEAAVGIGAPMYSILMMPPPRSVVVEVGNSDTGRGRPGAAAGGLRRGRPSVDLALQLDACEAR